MRLFCFKTHPQPLSINREGSNFAVKNSFSPSYTASKELIYLLEKNGFVDKTNNAEHSANVTKYAIDGTKNHITLNHGEILGYVNNTQFVDETTINENQLRSLIAFYKMGENFQHSYAEECLSLYKNEILLEDNLKFKKVFESVNLN